VATVLGLVIHLAFALAPFIVVFGFLYLIFKPSARKEAA
jgi:hypothetical protein